jgi:hypothetical protein
MDNNEYGLIHSANAPLIQPVLADNNLSTISKQLLLELKKRKCR